MIQRLWWGSACSTTDGKVRCVLPPPPSLDPRYRKGESNRWGEAEEAPVSAGVLVLHTSTSLLTLFRPPPITRRSRAPSQPRLPKSGMLCSGL
jgi:hypothetical protein